MSASTVFGIDLGTTYSCISYIDEHGQPVIVQNNEGELTTPSVVYFESADNVVVGKAARDAIRTDSARVVSRVKREMGNPDWRFEIDDKEYRPEEISSLVLRKVVEDAKVTTGKSIQDVVITCPAYFGSAQKEATRKAGEIAGLNVRYVIPEPTAAAIAFGEEHAASDTVLVYDLGGGTFDITLVDIKRGELTVLSTDGDAELGGANWDAELGRHFIQIVSDETGETPDDLTGESEFYADLLLIAEEAKKTLSSRETAKQVLMYGGDRIRAEVTRQDFAEITRHLLDRTMEMTASVIDRAARHADMPIPSRILLVGGSTYMPQVRERIAQDFPELEILQRDPNQIVAKGAAVFGLKMALEDKAVELINEKAGSVDSVESLSEASDEAREDALADAGEKFGLAAAAAVDLGTKSVTNVTSRSFGLQVFNERDELVISNMIHVDDQLPREVCREFFTRDDNQSAADIVVFENEIRSSDDNTDVDQSCCIELEQATLELGGEFPKGSSIDVTFRLSPDGLLQVIAEHRDSGRQIPIERRVEGVMTDAEVNVSKSRLTGLSVS